LSNICLARRCSRPAAPDAHRLVVQHGAAGLPSCWGVRRILFVQIALVAVFLPACTGDAPASGDISLFLGQRIEGPGQQAPQSTCEIPARLTNESQELVWFVAALPDVETRTLVRDPGDSGWTDITPLGCGYGLQGHELGPGASISFTLRVSADAIGKAIRFEIPLFSNPDGEGPAVRVCTAEEVLE
jgi:hypothetical protein